MAERVSVETVELRLRQQVSGPAEMATRALSILEAQIIREHNMLGRLDDQMLREKNALGRLEKEMAESNKRMALLKQGAVGGEGEGESVNIKAYRKEQAALVSLGDKISAQKSKIDGMTDRVAAQKDKIVSLNDKLTVMRDKTVDSKAGLSELGNALKANSADFGVAESGVVKFVSGLARVAPEIAGIVATAAVLTAAFAGLIATISKGIDQSGKLRDEFLHLKGDIAGMSIGWAGFFRGATVNATMLQSAIEKVSPDSALPREKVAAYASQLAQARIPANRLVESLHAMAIAGSVSDKQAQKFLAMASTARLLGQDVSNVAKVFEKTFGPISKQLTLSLPAQIMKLGEELNYMFKGADVDALLVGLQSILRIFDRNTDAAKTMREMIQYAVERAINVFLRLELVLLKTLLWFKEHKRALGIVEIAVKGVGVSFAIVGTIAVAALGAIAAGAALALTPLVVLGTAISTLISKWDSLKKALLWEGETFVLGPQRAINEFIDWLHDIDFSDFGKFIVEGIVNGVKSAAGGLADALSGAVFGAVDVTRTRAEIHSPSELSARMVGFPLIQGSVSGVVRGSGLLSDALASVTESAVLDASASVNGLSASLSGGLSGGLSAGLSGDLSGGLSAGLSGGLSGGMSGGLSADLGGSLSAGLSGNASIGGAVDGNLDSSASLGGLFGQSPIFGRPTESASAATPVAESAGQAKTVHIDVHDNTFSTRDEADHFIARLHELFEAQT